MSVPWVLEHVPHRNVKIGWYLLVVISGKHRGVWGVVGIWPTLGVLDPRLTLKDSMWLSGKCVWVCIWCQGDSWALFCNRFSQESWYFWSSPALVQFLLVRWHNIPVRPEGATTTHWACSAWGWGFSHGNTWGVGIHINHLWVCVLPSVTHLLVGWGSLFPNP